VNDKSNLDITSNSRTYTFADMGKKYRNFYAPSCRILVGGEDIFDMGAQISSVTVDHSILKACACSLVAIQVPGERKTRPIEQIFVPEYPVEVYLGYENSLEAVFMGSVTNLGVSFSQSGFPEVTVGCSDFSHLLMAGSNYLLCEKEQFASFTDVVTKILFDYLDGSRLVKCVVEEVETTRKPPFKQKGKSDYSFIKGFADQDHIDFYISGPNIYYHERRASGKPVVELVWGESLKSFRGDINTAKLVSDVEVKGWDKKKSFSVSASIDDVKDKVCSGKMFDFVEKAFENKAKLTVETQLKDKEAAEKQAKETLIERNKDFFSASGGCVGIPQIMAGRFICLEGLGDLLSGDYFITDAKHTLNSSGYSTGFTVVEAHG